LHLERFPAKWIPVRVKKTRQNIEIELRSDEIGTKEALGVFHNKSGRRLNLFFLFVFTLFRAKTL
jgi:hypothetical protein